MGKGSGIGLIKNELKAQLIKPTIDKKQFTMSEDNNLSSMADMMNEIKEVNVDDADDLENELVGAESDENEECDCT